MGLVAHAQTPDFARAMHVPRTEFFPGWGQAVAPDGTVTLGAAAQDTLLADGTLYRLPAAGAAAPRFYRSHFVLRTYSATGQLLRAFRPAQASAAVQALAADSAGNVYAAGYFAGSLVLGRDTLRPAAGATVDGFLCKLDPAGTVVWARPLGPLDHTNPDGRRLQQLVVDRQGNPWLAGTFAGTMRLGTTTCSTPGDRDVFVSKWTAQGQPVWTRQIGYLNDDDFKALDVDRQGNAYVAFDYYFSTRWGTTIYTIPQARFKDFCVGKLTAAGVPDWSRAVGTSVQDGVYGLKVHPSGDPVIAISSAANSSFGTALGGGAWLLRLQAATGAARHVGSLPGVPTSLDVDGLGNAYLGFGKGAVVSFGNGVTLPASAYANYVPALVMYSGEAVAQWAVTAQDVRTVPTGWAPQTSYPTATAVLADGTLLANGIGAFDVNFGSTTVVPALRAAYYTFTWKVRPPVGVAPLAPDPLWACPGTALSLPFTADASITAGNVFTAQLSDSTGSFATPVAVGTLPGTTSGSIAVTVPAGTLPGRRYRLRVVASAPRTLPASGAGVGLWITTGARAAVQPTAPVSICQGSALPSLTGRATVGATLQWLRGGQPIPGATSATYTPTQAGSYALQATSSCGTAVSPAVVYTVNPLPVVTLAPFAAVAVSQAPFALTGGAPAGGTYSGPGVSNNTFTPQAAGIGTHLLTYTYTDANGCTATATASIQVQAALASHLGVSAATLQVYPNPSTGLIRLRWNSGGEDAQLLLHNATGQLVRTGRVRLTPGEQVWDCRGVPAGVYVLQVLLPQGVLTRSLVLNP